MLPEVCSNCPEFVEPNFIDELDGYGLTVNDIAKSLNADPRYIRQKIRERGFIERMEMQDFKVQAFATINQITGLRYEDYALDICAAKFFVAKYNSEIGDSYLSFLIRLEMRAKEMEKMAEEDSLMREIAAIQRLRMRQLTQEKRLSAQEVKTEKLADSILDSILSTTQKQFLKKLIDSKGMSYGDFKFIGYIQRDLKKFFGLNSTNDKWYHISQRNYEKATEFVSNWNSLRF